MVKDYLICLSKVVGSILAGLSILFISTFAVHSVLQMFSSIPDDIILWPMSFFILLIIFVICQGIHQFTMSCVKNGQ